MASNTADVCRVLPAEAATGLIQQVPGSPGGSEVNEGTVLLLEFSPGEATAQTRM